MHRYQAGEEDRRRMLEAIGATSVAELFASIPAALRLDHLDLPPSRSEDEVRREFWSYATANTAPECFANFMGAGVYSHTSPAVVDALMQRGEFFTAYTPYQPEVSQGTLQAIFEFQTFVCQLTEMDVANASLYDGATSAVEAVLMAGRVHPDRSRVLLCGALHPEVLAVLRTYAEPMGLSLTTVPWDGDGRVDDDALAAALGDDVSALVVQSPNFLGVVEDLPAVAVAAKERGALSVQVVVEATSLGLLSPGGRYGFDVVCGDMQAFGLPAAFGGPHLGFFATRQAYLRQVPGRLVGETVDADGERAYVLTLSTREQHIRRARATSNICTNHGLMALGVTITLSLLGRKGVRELALSSHARAEYLKSSLRGGVGGCTLAFPQSATYNELFVLHSDPEGLLARLTREGILGGVPTVRFGDDYPAGLLVAVTERNTKAECDRLLDALGRLS